jgi:hypothetical protein
MISKIEMFTFVDRFINGLEGLMTFGDEKYRPKSAGRKS